MDSKVIIEFGTEDVFLLHRLQALPPLNEGVVVSKERSTRHRIDAWSAESVLDFEAKLSTLQNEYRVIQPAVSFARSLANSACDRKAGAKKSRTLKLMQLSAEAASTQQISTQSGPLQRDDVASSQQLAERLIELTERQPFDLGICRETKHGRWVAREVEPRESSQAVAEACAFHRVVSAIVFNSLSLASLRFRQGMLETGTPEYVQHLRSMFQEVRQLVRKYLAIGGSFFPSTIELSAWSALQDLLSAGTLTTKDMEDAFHLIAPLFSYGQAATDSLSVAWAEFIAANPNFSFPGPRPQEEYSQDAIAEGWPYAFARSLRLMSRNDLPIAEAARRIRLVADSDSAAPASHSQVCSAAATWVSYVDDENDGASEEVAALLGAASRSVAGADDEALATLARSIVGALSASPKSWELVEKDMHHFLDILLSELELDDDQDRMLRYMSSACTEAAALSSDQKSAERVSELCKSLLKFLFDRYGNGGLLTPLGKMPPVVAAAAYGLLAAPTEQGRDSQVRDQVLDRIIPPLPPWDRSGLVRMARDLNIDASELDAADTDITVRQLMDDGWFDRFLEESPETPGSVIRLLCMPEPDSRALRDVMLLEGKPWLYRGIAAPFLSDADLARLAVEELIRCTPDGPLSAWTAESHESRLPIVTPIRGDVVRLWGEARPELVPSEPLRGPEGSNPLLDLCTIVFGHQSAKAVCEAVAMRRCPDADSHVERLQSHDAGMVVRVSVAIDHALRLKKREAAFDLMMAIRHTETPVTFLRHYAPGRDEENWLSVFVLGRNAERPLLQHFLTRYHLSTLFPGFN